MPPDNNTPTTTPDPAGTGGVFASQEWTAERIRALGVVCSLPTASAIFGLSKSTGYELASRGEYPVPVLKVGARYRVAVARILDALGLPLTADLMDRRSGASIRPDKSDGPATGATTVGDG